MFQFDRPMFQNELSRGRHCRRSRRGRALLRVGVCAGVVRRLEARVARRGTPCPLCPLRLRPHIVVHHVAVPVDVAVVVVVLGVEERLGDVLL